MGVRSEKRYNESKSGIWNMVWLTSIFHKYVDAYVYYNKQRRYPIVTATKCIYLFTYY